jgi:hypothetical protein
LAKTQEIKPFTPQGEMTLAGYYGPFSGILVELW